MTRRLFCLSILSLVFLSACASARKPVPPGTIPAPRPVSASEEEYGHTVLTKLNEQFELDYNDPRLDTIRNIVDKLTQTAGAGNDPWHVYLFKAPQIKNAAATRGNHVFVWSGMLDFAKGDEELATVISHEIAHVLAGHTDPDPNLEAKRMLVGLGAAAAGIAAGIATGDPTAARTLGNLTANVTHQIGSGILVNPYSRERELEADHVGLFLMADAKYNPDAALSFWERAMKTPDFSSSLEFFSTHPLAKDRLKALEKYIPSARDRYRGIRSSAPTTSPRLPSNQPSKPPKINNGGKDSFDWGQSSSTGTHVSRTAIVISSNAVLYTMPNRRSKPLGEFRKGAKVDVVSVQRNWVKINSPDRGFLQRSQLKLHQ